MNTTEVLKKKMEELSYEAQNLVNERVAVDTRRQEIDMRLVHITGALSELDQLLKSLEVQDETRDNSEARIPESAGQTDEEQPSDQDSVQA